jgi:hypothetical protein
VVTEGTGVFVGTRVAGSVAAGVVQEERSKREKVRSEMYLREVERMGVFYRLSHK